MKLVMPDRRPHRGRTRRGPHAVLITLVSAGLLAVAGQAFGAQDDLAGVRAATARFHRIPVAQEAGWDLVAGLDHCFEHPDLGGMGYHYINFSLFDAVADPVRPEALVYAPGPDGTRHLAAVEWIVPAAAWNETGTDGPPAVLGQELHLNEALGVWVLHAWIFRHNPAGMFEDWNPHVDCP